MTSLKLKLPRFFHLENWAGLWVKMLLIFILSGLIPLALFGFIADRTTVNSMEKKAFQAGPLVLKSISANFDQLTRNIETASSQIASSREIAVNLSALDDPNMGEAERDAVYTKINDRFQPWIASNRQIERIFILGIPDGTQTENIGVIGASTPVAGIDPAVVRKAPWFHETVNSEGKPLWIPTPAELENRGDFGISCIRRIPGTNSRFTFVLIIKLNPGQIYQIFSRTLFAGGGQIYLIDPRRTIWHDKPNEPGKAVQARQSLIHLKDLISSEAFQKQTGPGHSFAMKQTSPKAAGVFYQPLRLSGWFLLGTISEPQWTGPFVTTKLGYIIIILLFSSWVIWGSLLFARYWGEPLPRILATFKQVASGAPAHPIDIRWDNEIGLLAKIYNRVLEKYKRITGDTDLITRELQSITEQIVEKTGEVTECSNSIFNTLDELTEVTANEAAEVMSCISNINLLSESIHFVNDYAIFIQQMKTDILQLTTQGKAALENLELRSNETKTITIEINRLIYNLNEQTQEIQDIVTRIREIVVQTDMISLNATIEATRIKDIKKEVLALAHDVKKHVDYSASAIRQITEVILRIESKTSQATAMAEVANEAVETQSKIIQQCTQVFNDIRNSTNFLVEKFEAVIGLMGMVEANKNDIMVLTEIISVATEQIAIMTETLSSSFHGERPILENLNEDAGELDRCMNRLRESVREYAFD
jgi:methyl-accepting chemotaxis protein